jgi:hypothetical protein
MKILYYALITASLLILLFNRQRLDRRLYLFIPLLIFALLPDGTGDLLGPNHWLTNLTFTIYSPVEYLLLCIIIASYLKNRWIKKIIYYSIPLFAVFSVIVQVWLKPLGFFYKYLDVLVEDPLLCLWTLFYFFQFAADEDEVSFKDNPMFWISIGNLLFYSASTFSYGFGGYLAHLGNAEYADIVFWIGRIFNLVLYLFYIIAFTSTIWKRKF